MSEKTRIPARAHTHTWVDRFISIAVEYSIDESFKWKISYYVQNKVNWNWDEWRLVLIVICTETPPCANIQTVIAMASSVSDHANWELNIQTSVRAIKFAYTHSHQIATAKCTWTLHCNFNNHSTTTTERKRAAKKNLSRGPGECFCTWNLHHHQDEEDLSHCYRKQFYLHGQLPFCKHFWMIFFSHRASSCAHSTRRQPRWLRWRQLIYSACRELCRLFFCFVFRDLWTIMQ